MGIQAVLCTVAYLNTATWPGVGATVTMVTADIQSRVGEPLFFVLLVFIHLFYPLQGFGNFFVYNHFQITLQKWLREKDHSYCRQCFDWTKWNATNRSQSAPKTSSDAQTMKSSPGPTQKVNKQELLPTSGEEGRVWRTTIIPFVPIQIILDFHVQLDPNILGRRRTFCAVQ